MNPTNILIVKLSAIGDVIHALPVSHALKQTYPQARVTWIVEPPAYDLLTNNPYIDEVLVFEKKKFKSLGGFLKNVPSFSASLKRAQYDVVLDLQGLGKSAAIAYLTQAPRKLGTCNMREYSDRISQPVCGPHAKGHIVQQYLDVARFLGCEVGQIVFPIHCTAKEVATAEALMKQAGMDSQNPYVILAPGANWPNKRWPPAHYAHLASWLYERGVIPVVIGGGVVDDRLVAEIQAAMEIPPVDLVGKTTLKQLAHVISRAKALVGGDTGTMHLAAALGKPAIALMGPTDANRNGPFGQPQNAIEIEAACKYCWKRQCALNKDCLAQIVPTQVVEKLRPYI